MKKTMHEYKVTLSQLHCFSRITFPFFLTLVLKILQIFEQNFVWIDSLTPPPKITCRISGTWVARWHWSSGRTCPRNHRLSASDSQARLLPALVTDANSSLQLCWFHWSACHTSCDRIGTRYGILVLGRMWYQRQLYTCCRRYCSRRCSNHTRCNTHGHTRQYCLNRKVTRQMGTRARQPTVILQSP